MFDYEKLSPSPWVAKTVPDGAFVAAAVLLSPWRGTKDTIYFGQNWDDAGFIAMARNAFEVMMRRGWAADKSDVEGEGWRVMTFGDYFAFTEDGLAGLGWDNTAPIPHWPDPFTALVEADKWYAANIEGMGK